MKKRILALILSAIMVLGCSVTALADSNVDGAGIIEYDNSTPVEITSITVPTLKAADYNFTIDTDGLLNKYDASNYPTANTVYFTSTGTPAQVDVSETKGVASDAADSTLSKGEVYKRTVAPVSDIATESGFITAITKSEGAISTVTVGSDYAVWVPDTTTGNEGRGKFLDIDATNVTTYFDLTATDDTHATAAMKTSHESGNSVCDGKLYKYTYTKQAADFDATDYVTYTVGNDTITVTAVKDLYDGKHNAIAPDNVAIIKAEPAQTATSNKVKVVNNTTKKKTVTATVTVKDVGPVAFKESSTFADEDEAGLYLAATNKTEANASTSTTAVAKKTQATATTASAVYTVTLEKAARTELTYQASGTSATGGHNYKRYEAYGATPTSDEFWITAAANNTTKGKAAWKAYSATIDGTTVKVPSINIVYSVTDFVEAPTKYTVTYTKGEGATGDNQTEDVTIVEGQDPKPTKANTTAWASSFTRDGYHIVGWKDGEGNDVDNDTVLTGDITLIAQWEETYSAATMGYANWEGTTLWLAPSSSQQFSDGAELVVEISEDQSSFEALEYSVTSNYVGVTWANVSSKLSSTSVGTHYYIRVTDPVAKKKYTYSGTIS